MENQPVMIFKETKFAGVYIIELEKRNDDRGFLARIFDADQFKEKGISFFILQGYITRTKERGTFRGLHYQISPKQESKYIRCVKGSIDEIIIDLRKSSKTYKQWMKFTFAAEDCKMLFIPEYVAHGILTLEDNVEVLNLTGATYSKEFERGVRLDDPCFSIELPHEIKNISEKDLAWPDFKE